MALDPNELWAQCLLNIEGRVRTQSFNIWFRPTSVRTFDDEQLVIEVQSAWSADYVERSYLELIQRVVREETGLQPNIRFQVCSQPVAVETGTAAPPDPSKMGTPSTAALPTLDSKKNPLSVSDDSDGLLGHLFSVLNEKYKFATFVTGDGNSFAHAAAQAVAKSPGNTQFNPLVIYGAVGLGKTHLLQAIGHHALSHSLADRVAYVPSEKFVSDFIHVAIKMDRRAEFQRLYRRADILLVDDIQFLPKTEATQNEFFHTFNALYQAGKQIVMTCDSPPGKLVGLEERLVSRFQWGLVTNIDPPDLETRIAILHQKAEINGIQLPETVAAFLGNHVSSNIRELEGALIHIMAFCSVNNSELTIEAAKKIIQERSPSQTGNISIEIIQQLIAEHFDLTPQLLVGKTRKKEVATARQIAMYLAKQLTENPLKMIGFYFGNRDHSTVIHAINTVLDKRKADPSFAQLVDDLYKRLQQRPSNLT